MNERRSPRFPVALTALSVSVVAAGCGGWTQAHRDNAMNEFRSTTLTKAAFSLSCDPAKVTVELVPVEEAFPTSALVSGCGQRATYVKTKAGWVMESGPGR
jgi:hypothetical protein